MDKQRIVVTLDLAAAHTGRDAAHAFHLVAQAIDLLAVDYYATGYERLMFVLPRLPERPYRHEVEARLRDVIGTGPEIYGEAVAL